MIFHLRNFRCNVTQLVSTNKKVIISENSIVSRKLIK